LFECVEIVIVFRRNFPFDKLPDPFNQIKVRAAWWYVFKLDFKLPGKFLHNATFLVPCIVKHEMDFFPTVFSSNFSGHVIDLCSSYVTVICHNKHFFGDIVQCPKDIVVFASGKCPDITPHPAINMPKEVTAHYEVGCIQEQQ